MTGDQNEPMRVEDEIDAALTILRETQPPSEMVSRVHRRMENAAMSQRASSGRRLLMPTAGMAAAALALVVTFTQMHRAPEARRSTETAKLVATVPLDQATAVPPAAPVAPENFEEGKRSVQPTAVRRVRREHRKYRHATNLLSYPLTRQEKLLLEFAHKAKPADLQALNPEYQAKLEARQDAEFAAYLKSGSGSDTQSTTQSTESTRE
jgi:hypothetical protein